MFSQFFCQAVGRRLNAALDSRYVSRVGANRSSDEFKRLLCGFAGALKGCHAAAGPLSLDAIELPISDFRKISGCSIFTLAGMPRDIQLFTRWTPPLLLSYLSISATLAGPPRPSIISLSVFMVDPFGVLPTRIN